MGWVEDLPAGIVAVDTAPVIAFISREAPYLEVVRPLFLAIAQGRVQAVTSMITLAEVLVRPLRGNNIELATSYEDILLHSDHITTMPFTEAVARKTAELRATLNLRTPDAIQVATALLGNASILVTNDKRVRVPQPLQRVILDDLLTSPQTSSPSR